MGFGFKPVRSDEEYKVVVLVRTDLDMGKGTVRGSVYCTGEIKSGIFDADSQVICDGTITGGTFNGEVRNVGTITGGTFNSQVTNPGRITGGTFKGGITGTPALATGSGTENDPYQISTAEGLKFRVMGAPGHTAGSCLLFTEIGGEPSAFCGDVVFCMGVGRTDGYSGSTRYMLDSLEKIAKLPGDFKLYPGHGSTTTLDYERQNNPYLGRYA